MWFIKCVCNNLLILLEVDSDRCLAETVKILCFAVTVFVELPVEWGLAYFTMDMCVKMPRLIKTFTHLSDCNKIKY